MPLTPSGNGLPRLGFAAFFAAITTPYDDPTPPPKPTAKRIAEFTPEDYGLGVEINALTISRDGKTLVWGHETKVISMEFKTAFELRLARQRPVVNGKSTRSRSAIRHRPLPPASPPPGPDILPWK